MTMNIKFTININFTVNFKINTMVQATIFKMNMSSIKFLLMVADNINMVKYSQYFLNVSIFYLQIDCFHDPVR